MHAVRGYPAARLVQPMAAACPRPATAQLHHQHQEEARATVVVASASTSPQAQSLGPLRAASALFTGLFWRGSKQANGPATVQVVASTATAITSTAVPVQRFEDDHTLPASVQAYAGDGTSARRCREEPCQQCCGATAEELVVAAAATATASLDLGQHHVPQAPAAPVREPVAARDPSPAAAATMGDDHHHRHHHHHHAARSDGHSHGPSRAAAPQHHDGARLSNSNRRGHHVAGATHVHGAAKMHYREGLGLQLPAAAHQSPDQRMHPTLQLIEQRAASGSMPGKRSEPFRLGLVVEGGGMRGVITGAMLMGLYALGLRNVFDVVIGASAGAINATYFLTGQRKGLDIYHEDLTGTRFLDPWAGVSWAGLAGGGSGAPGRKRRPIMDLDYLLDHVMRVVKPLDWPTVLSSPVPLKVVASSLDALEPVLLEGFESEEDLVECLKASATVPEFAGPPRLVRGHRLVDAAVFEPVPVQTAIRDGCTHVLVLCSRPAAVAAPTWRRTVHSTVVRAVKNAVLSPPYMRPAWASAPHHLMQQKDEALAAALHSCPLSVRDSLGAYVLPVYPSATHGCHPVCTNVQTLRAGMEEGFAAVNSVMAHLASLTGGAPASAGFSSLGGGAAAAASSSTSVQAKDGSRLLIDTVPNGIAI